MQLIHRYCTGRALQGLFDGTAYANFQVTSSNRARGRFRVPARPSDQGMKTKVVGRVRTMMAESIARFKKHIALATFGLMTMMKNSGVDSQCFTLVFMKARKQDKMKIRVKLEIWNSTHWDAYSFSCDRGDGLCILTMS